MKPPLKIQISRDGTLTSIYSDALAGLLSKGEAKVTRASHVEPCDGGWTADMSPVGGPVLFASDGKPFRLRSEALAAEVGYLESSIFASK